MPTATSPVFITTSSPDDYCAPTITPPSLQHRQAEDVIADNAIHTLPQPLKGSSSPSLLSPSAFVPVRPKPGLKSGSRAQQLPVEAHTSFASAGALWKSNYFPLVEEPIDQRDEVAIPRKEAKKKASRKTKTDDAEDDVVWKISKPSRPRKKRKTEDVHRGKGQIIDETSAYFKASNVEGPALEMTADNGCDDILNDKQVYGRRRGSFTFIEYEFTDTNDVRKEKAKVETVTAPTKKPRQRRNGSTTKGPRKSKNDPKPKTVREQKIKSASIILNSDEPDASDTVSVLPAAEEPTTAAETSTLPSNAPEGRQTLTSLISVPPSAELIEKSDYFGVVNAQTSPIPGPPNTVDTTADEKSVFGHDRSQSALFLASPNSQPHILAPKRRLSWTPVKPAASFLSDSITPSNGSSDSVPPPHQLQQGALITASRQSFGDILGGFVHMPAVTEATDTECSLYFKNQATRASPTAPTRIPTGQGELPKPTKRRRLSLTTGPAIGIQDMAPVRKKRKKTSAKEHQSPLEGDAEGTGVEKVPRKKVSKERVPKTSKQAKEKQPKEKKPKKPKGKRKVQTITALATAAFHQPIDVVSVTTNADIFNNDVVPGEAQVGKTLQTKSPVPAIKTSNCASSLPKAVTSPAVIASNDLKASTTSVKAPTLAKPKAKKRQLSAKAKAKQDADAHPGRGIHDPSRVRLDIEKQDFLFGTSSQIRLEESPDFIRDLKIAVDLSETIPPPDNVTSINERDQCGFTSTLLPHLGFQGGSPAPVDGGSLTGSALRVPTAPHGTHLSIRQAESKLWDRSSRDCEGGFLRNALGGLLSVDSASAFDEDDAVQILDHPITGHTVSIEATLPGAVKPKAASEAAIESVDDGLKELIDNELVDEAESVGPTTETVPNQVSTIPDDPEDDDDTWMLLQSDDSIVVPTRLPTHRQDKSMPVDSASNDFTTSGNAPPSGFVSPRDSVKLFYSPRRSPLRPLDRNIPLQPVMDVDKRGGVHQVSAFATAAANQVKASESQSSPPKRRPGRPRKGAAVAQTSPTSSAKATVVGPAKQRGRPRKDSTNIPSSSSATTALPKKRGRPPKAKDLVALDAAGAPSSSGQWHDIDEISDSDSPVTPSPPRKKKKACANTPVTTLELSPPASQAIAQQSMATVATDASRNGNGLLKSNDPQWLELRSTTFDKITKQIKHPTDDSVAHGNQTVQSSGTSSLTWYQKILLFDPLVAEELTAWLNTKDLSVPVRKAKPKLKNGKGKKAKEASEGDEAVEAFEIVREPLQTWMVQKWCEENSVCCYTQESSWRGARSRNH